MSSKFEILDGGTTRWSVLNTAHRMREVPQFEAHAEDIAFFKGYDWSQLRYYSSAIDIEKMHNTYEIMVHI